MLSNPDCVVRHSGELWLFFNSFWPQCLLSEQWLSTSSLIFSANRTWGMKRTRWCVSDYQETWERKSISWERLLTTLGKLSNDLTYENVSKYKYILMHLSLFLPKNVEYLPVHLRNSDFVVSFCKNTKSHFFQIVLCWL